MEFLKALFEAGALTWEQFSDAVKKAGFEVVNAAGGAYVPKADLDAKQQELDTANNTIKGLRETAKAWDGKDPKKLEDDLKDLQTKYDIQECGLPTKLSQLHSKTEITPELLRQVADSVNLLPNGPRQLTHHEVYDILTECL